MAGGTWTSQNKTLPGVYINVKSKESVSVSVGSRGIVAIAKALSWGKPGVIQAITPGEDMTPCVGYDITSEKAAFLREMMKGSDTTSGPSKILLYRIAGSGGAKASVTTGNLTATALYEGVRGNDITIIIEADPDTSGSFDVKTVVDGAVVDEQTGAKVSDLAANSWVTFSGSDSLAATAGAALTGGADATASASDHSRFLAALEPYRFDVVIYDGSESTVIQAYAAFVKRMSESVGRKCQAVMAGDDAADCNSEFVIAVKNGVVLNDGTELSAQEATWWVGASEAGALYNESLTCARYPNASAANPKLTDAEAEEAIQAGQLCFIDDFDIVRVCTDINSLTTFTTDKGQEFSKNRVMRVLMQFCNDTYEQFSLNYIGKIDNNDTGRNLLKAWIVGYLNEMQANSGIQNFTAEDVEVLEGNTVDSVVINVALQPVDSVEKIYMTVTVSATTETE